MKRTGLLLMTLLLLNTAFGQAKEDSVGYVQDEVGILNMIGGEDLWVINTEETRYFLRDLDEQFKQEGAKVKFSGVMVYVAPNMKMAGTPIIIRTIEFVKEENFTGKVTNIKGVVFERNGVLLIECQTGNAVTIYEPIDGNAMGLETGQEVVFTGMTGEFIPGGIGIPLKITELGITGKVVGIEVKPGTKLEGLPIKKVLPGNKDTKTVILDNKNQRILNDVDGKVLQLDETLYVIESVRDGHITRYVAENMTDEFKVHGLKVRFSGELQVMPEGVKMAGAPIILTSIAKIKNQIEVPAFIQELIDGYMAEKPTNPPMRVYSGTYEGKRVYYIPQPCCDQFNELYNEEGKLLCYPDGGITGMGDGKCPGFHQQCTDLEVIWKDMRSRRKDDRIEDQH